MFKSKKILKKVILAICIMGSLNATVVKDIKITGLTHISELKALDLISVRSGKEFDIKSINESIKTLYAQGYFESIEVNYINEVLTFVTTSKPNIANIEIIGFDALKHDEALKLLGLKKGMLYDKYQITKAKKMLNAFWEYRGYLGSNVIVEIENINDTAVNVKFKANRGSKVTITDFTLDGDDSNYKKATSKLQNRKKEFLGWLWGRDDGELNIAKLGKDYSDLKDYYLSLGYIDVELSKPLVQADLSTAKASIGYQVTLGEQYKIGTVDLSDSSLYEKKLKTKSEDLFDVFKLRADIKGMQESLSRLGYAQVIINPKFEKDIDSKTINIYFDLKIGKKIYVRNVTIQGNIRTLDSIIRRELYLIPGNVYTSVNYNDSIIALQRLGYFDTVVIDKTFVDDSTVDITVDVTEGSTGSLIGSIGYGSDGLLLNLKVNDRNIFGSGIETGISLDHSSTTTKGELYFNNPRFNDSDYSFGASIFKKKYDFTSYDEDKIGLSLKVGKKLTRNLNVSLTYGLENIKLTDIDVNSSRLYDEGSNIKSFVTPYLSYNSTDSYFLPRKGFKFSSSFQYASLGGDMDFMKSFSKFSAFYGFKDFLGYDLILRYKANVKLAKDNGYLPINEKLYLGGLSTLRGFKTNSLSPENSYGDLTGGKKLFSTSVELSIPLIESAKMRLFGFYDYGAIGEVDIDEITRSSYGWGIEWLTAMGPLQFVFSTPKSESGDSTSKFDFTIGTQF